MAVKVRVLLAALLGLYWSSFRVEAQPPPSAPSGVMVDGVDDISVTVSWQTVDDADRYTVTFTKTRTTSTQQGVCIPAEHVVSVSVDAHSTSTSIGVGQMLEREDTAMLRAYTTYSITVVAVNNVTGSSGDSVAITVTTTQTSATAAPRNVMATVVSSTVISVQWDGLEPCRHSNGRIAFYRVQYTAVASGVVQSKTMAGEWNVMDAMTSLTGLTSSTSYSIEVAAVNVENEVGVYSDPLTRQTLLTQPGVTVISITATSISLSWTSAGSEVDSYEVIWTSDECPDNVDEGSATINETSYIIEGLREGTRYTITVSATNSADTSHSDSVTGETQELAPSAAPTSVITSSDSSSSITIQWGSVDCIHRNGDITGYSVQYGVVGSGSTQTVSVSGGATRHTTIFGLRSSSAYAIQVAARNSAGTGLYSAPINQLTSVEAPSISVDLTSVTPTTIPLTWTSAGSVVNSYEVEWRYDGECSGVRGGSATVVGSMTNYSIEGLEEYITYSITVTADNSIGSALSEIATVRTSAATPSGPPTSVRTTGTSSSITVRWGAVDCIHRNGDLMGYSVQYEVVGSGSTQTVSVSGGATRRTTIFGLRSSSTYAIQVAARNIAGIGLYSVPTNQLTSVEAPSISVDLTSVTPSTIPLMWSSAGSIVNSYEVEWNYDGECSGVRGGRATVVGSMISYTIEGLEEYITYSITVTAGNDIGSAVSDVTTVKTSAASPSAPPTPVSAPAHEVTSSSITVQWGPVECIHRNGDITGYSVQYGVVGSGSTQTVSVSGGATRRTTIFGLKSSRIYSIQVAAMNIAGIGPFSAPTNQLTSVEAPSISVDLTSVTPTTIPLMWTSAGLVVNSYEVKWRYNGECSGVRGGRATVGEAMTSYTIEGLEEYITYSVTVTAGNDVGSAVSEVATVTTSEATPSAPPSSVSATSTSTTITVLWGAVDCIHRNGNITGYTIQYGVVGSGNTHFVSFSGDASTEGTISGLMPSTAYSIHVAAVNSAGIGAHSVDLTMYTADADVYASLNSDIIPNHDYVLISDIGSTSDTALICHTNRPASINNFNSGGDWFGPNNTRVNSNDDVPGFRRNRAPMILRLLRNTATDPATEGIYYCVMEDHRAIPHTVFVGLYYSGRGDIIIFGDMAFSVDSDLNGASPQFTLTCISTGGPATIVTWTRDSDTVTEGTETVLDDPLTAQYTHNLTVTGRLGGLYTCTVANDKPSQDSAQLLVEVPSEPTTISSMTNTDPTNNSNITSSATDSTSNNNLTTTDSTTTTSDNNGAIAGGVVTVILVISIIIAVVAIVVGLVLKYRRGNISISKRKENVVGMSTFARGSGGLSTATNPAYWMRKQAGERQGNLDYEEVGVAPVTDQPITAITDDYEMPSPPSGHPCPTTPQPVTPPTGEDEAVAREGEEKGVYYNVRRDQ